MAGDWTPIEHSTMRKPEVLRLAAMSSRSRHEVLGLLCDFWTWADQQCEDGRLCLALSDLPHVIGADARFWQAVASVGWLKEEAGCLLIPNSEHWLGKGAKARLMNTRRQSARRAVGATKARPQKRREEKRREENLNTPPTPKGGKPAFTKPTLEEVTAYCRERANLGKPAVDPELFVDHYEANGWVQGSSRKPVKDWKACVRTWEKNEDLRRGVGHGGRNGSLGRSGRGELGKMREGTRSGEYDNVPDRGQPVVHAPRAASGPG